MRRHDLPVPSLRIAVPELRQIAHGLRPSSLDDGLPAALARLVRSVLVTVEMDVHSGPLPDDVATTAYFVVSEAVTNAVKHAEATRIQLCVTRVDGRVVVPDHRRRLRGCAPQRPVGTGGPGGSPGRLAKGRRSAGERDDGGGGSRSGSGSPAGPSRPTSEASCPSWVCASPPRSTVVCWPS
jgi:two-component sensor histidine kinase